MFISSCFEKKGGNLIKLAPPPSTHTHTSSDAHVIQQPTFTHTPNSIKSAHCFFFIPAIMSGMKKWNKCL